VLVGLGLAGLAWTAIFRGPKEQFWPRMTLGAGGLGLYALVNRPALRRERPRWRDLALGLGSAGALYGIFQVGDRMARLVMPKGEGEIASIYDLRTRAPRPAIAAALALVIAPSEELFWRGVVQHGLEHHLGRGGAALLTSSLYGGIHLVSGNLTLTGAAGVAGLFWGALYAAEQRLPTLIVSHVAWDLWIFLIAPTS
jgi:uncharacterized protein